MMSSTTPDQNFIDARAPLSEPHFNEEATVLSARPVVPLEEVRSSRNFTWLARPWVLGLSLAGALLIGISATAFYYSQSDVENPGLFEGMEVASGAEGISNESVNLFSGPASTQPKVEAETTPNTKAPVDSGAANPKAEPAQKPRPRLVAVINEQKGNQVEDQTEDRRAARREARRERRRTQRERRGAKSDDLMRIRDIFEGSPRP